MSSNRQPNKLIDEKSPYLLQHAYNPVNWFPWGEEAFEKAKAENKPIFLSIGYATCHWCHVMAHESFEDPEVASLLNANYVSIKVDREERPDVDSVYMKVCQMMTGHGGWPLTIFMTPEQIPFYAGTYFPKESKYQMPGMMDALPQLYEKFTNDPDRITEVTDSVKQALAQTVSKKSEHRLTQQSADEAYQQLAKGFDFTNGGFGSAPKFPQPQNILFLLHYYHFAENITALKMAETTLQAMARGGIYDHVGFGFSRYATDTKWLVPHFEKMLYDNALLLMAYTECYQITKNPLYKQISEQIITFIKREMLDQQGGFYSAIDADAEGVEGKYYVWGYEEVFDILGEELGEIYADAYGMTPYGNFEWKNIPNLIGSNFEKIAVEHDLSAEALNELLERARLQLLEAREKRVYPEVDDKILTGWNGLMIAALAKAGNVFSKQEYVDLAERANQFIWENLFQNHRLLARYRDGESKYAAYIDDYAFLLWGALELYEATFSLEHLKKARKLADLMSKLFWDEKDGGFYFSSKDSETLIASDKEIFDGAIPSGNSVAAVMLTRLGYATGETTYLDRAEEMYHSFYEDINGRAIASPFFMISILLSDNPTKEVVILGEASDAAREKVVESLTSRFTPDITLLAADRPEQFAEIAPFAAAYKKLDERATIYVCENFACQAPTTDTEVALNTIWGKE